MKEIINKAKQIYGFHPQEPFESLRDVLHCVRKRRKLRPLNCADEALFDFLVDYFDHENASHGDDKQVNSNDYKQR